MVAQRRPMALGAVLLAWSWGSGLRRLGVVGTLVRWRASASQGAEWRRIWVSLAQIRSGGRRPLWLGRGGGPVLGLQARLAMS